jgi:hypothetical protein
MRHQESEERNAEQNGNRLHQPTKNVACHRLADVSVEPDQLSSV